MDFIYIVWFLQFYFLYAYADQIFKKKSMLYWKIWVLGFYEVAAQIYYHNGYIQ